jgi:zinc transport system substrate-binding protein
MTSSVRRIAALATVPLLVLAACGDDDDDGGGAAGASGDQPVRVVAAFYPIAEAATQVGGDRVEVTNLTPAGTEPHDLELSPDQVDDIEDADVVLYLGQGFQPAVAESAERRDGVTLDLLESIDLEAGASEALEEEEHGEEGEGDDHAEEEGDEEHAEEGEDDDHAEGGGDPHFWLDPRLMADGVDVIEGALADAAPDDAEAFAAGAQGYQDELATLDEDLEAGLADCERDEIVTSHAAFHYLAERYDLTQLPIAGLSPEAEPDADRLAELADQVESDGVTTVFYEDLVSPDVAETLAREAGVETARLSPIEGLTEDQAEAGDDYLSVMRANLAALQDALGCGE